MPFNWKLFFSTLHFFLLALFVRAHPVLNLCVYVFLSFWKWLLECLGCATKSSSIVYAWNISLGGIYFIGISNEKKTLKFATNYIDIELVVKHKNLLRVVLYMFCGSKKERKYKKWIKTPLNTCWWWPFFFDWIRHCRYRYRVEWNNFKRNKKRGFHSTNRCLLFRLIASINQNNEHYTAHKNENKLEKRVIVWENKNAREREREIET